MGETFKAFIAFISEDPIMLGLCIAIVVLIIMFILVLVLGKKKDKKPEAVENTNEELLKTEINMEALKSTSEFKLDELGQTSPEKTEENAPVVEEIPVTTEEPIKVEFEDKVEDTVAPTIDTLSESEEKTNSEISAYPTFDNIQITENRETKEEISEPIIEEDLNNLSVLESAEIPLESEELQEKIVEPIKEDRLEENKDIVESTINPIEVSEPIETPILEETTFPIFTETPTLDIPPSEAVEIPSEPLPTDLYEMPTIDIPNITLDDNILSVTPQEEEFTPPPVKENTPIEETTQIVDEENVTIEKPAEDVIEPLSEPIIQLEEPKPIEDIPVEPIELPEMTSEEDVELPDYSDIYSIDDIELPNIIFDDLNNSLNGTEKHEDNEEDLDLPKLNTNTSQTLNNLQGESFKID